MLVRILGRYIEFRSQAVKCTLNNLTLEREMSPKMNIVTSRKCTVVVPAVRFFRALGANTAVPEQ